MLNWKAPLSTRLQKNSSALNINSAHKATSNNGLSAKFLKTATPAIAYPLWKLINHCLNTLTFSLAWKSVNIQKHWKQREKGNNNLSPRAPWYSDKIKSSKRSRRNAERKWRTTKSQSDLHVLKTARNRTNFLKNEAKCKFYTDFVNENSHDTAKLFTSKKHLLWRDKPLSWAILLRAILLIIYVIVSVTLVK